MHKLVLCGQSLDRQLASLDAGGIVPRAADEEAVRLTGKARPRVLVIAAGRTYPALTEQAGELYAGELGCEVTRLPTSGEELTAGRLQQQLDQTDLIYVDATDTLILMRFLRSANLDWLLRGALAAGRTLLASGPGAGACFAYSLATLEERPGEPSHIRVRGLGLVECLGCPGGEIRGRLEATKNIIGQYGGLALSLHSTAQFSIVDDRYQTLGTAGSSGIERIYKIREQVVVEPIPWQRDRQPLSTLITRPTEVPPNLTERF